MRRLRFLVLVLIGSSIISLTSCSKDDDTVEDIRNQYVGTWNYTELGSLTLYHNGQNAGTVPIDTNGSMSITKSGENDLIINGKRFTVSGTHLSSDPESITETTDGVNIVATYTRNGTLGSNIITINSSITGTWNNSYGASGNLSGSTTTTLTK